ncbi:MAG: class D sortase [Thermoanaerobaculia bacterium]
MWKRIEGALWAIAAAAGLYLGSVYADRELFAAHESRLLAETTTATEMRTARALPRVDRPFVARLEIPAAPLTALVVDGVDDRTLRRAVGRIPGSSLPGNPGDVALAGHRDTDFRSLGRVSIGDRLSLRTADGKFQYEVESIRIVSPQQVEVLKPLDHPTLTLVTCFPFRFVGRAPLRYVVRAREVGRPGALAV